MKGPILFAEDISGDWLQECLERQGYLVMLYQDGRKLMDDINDGLKYKLAIIDLSLPGVDGEEIINLSKRLYPQVPIISISGFPYKPINSDRSLNKPFSSKELEVVVNEFFKTPSSCSRE